MKKLPTVRNGGSGCYHIQGGCELTKEKYMKNQELSKKISALEREIENIKQIVESQAKPETDEPSIFERFPVGSYLCGMKVLKHENHLLSFNVELRSGDVAWIEKELAEALAACHDWIEKHHPFLEAYRKLWEDMVGSPVLQHAIAAQKVGLWANKTPIKKPWEDA